MVLTKPSQIFIMPVTEPDSQKFLPHTSGEVHHLKIQNKLCQLAYLSTCKQVQVYVTEELGKINGRKHFIDVGVFSICTEKQEVCSVICVFCFCICTIVLLYCFS